MDTVYTRYIKRGLDIFFSLSLLLFLSPVLLILLVLVRVKLGSPVIFKQQRPGKGEQLFMMYKFRTMTDQRNEQGDLLSDADRLTKFGSFLRSTSLDELPELWNILMGEMSFVGPRPLLPIYLDRYNEEQRKRHFVRPGLTGWAQVNGRNAIRWEEKFELDIEYVKKGSFVFDAKIIARTMKQVLQRKDISGSDHVTSEEFKGTTEKSDRKDIEDGI